jgi:hypothetical protein
MIKTGLFIRGYSIRNGRTLENAIAYYNNNKYSDAYNILIEISKKPGTNETKGIIHLYLAKTLMEGSSYTEYKGIKHLKKAQDLLNNSNIRPEYMKYKTELAEWEDKIKIDYGSIGEYQNKLYNFIKSLGLIK